MTNKELKTLNVGGKDLNYIEYTTTGGVTFFSTTFMSFGIPSNYEDLFGGIGGTSREVLLNTVQEYEADTLTILSEVRGGENGVFFLYEKEGEIKYDPVMIDFVFLQYVVKFVIKNETILGKVKVENSLQYLNDSKYGKYLEKYDEPVHVEQSGLFFGGEPILFGDTFLIKGLTGMENFFKGDLATIVASGVDTLQVKVNNEVGGWDTVSENSLLKEDGSLYTYMDFERDTNSEVKGFSDEEILNYYIKMSMESTDKRLANKRNALVESGEYTPEEVEEEMVKHKAIINYDKQLGKVKKRDKKELEERFPVILTRSGLNTVLKREEVRFERVDK